MAAWVSVPRLLAVPKGAAGRGRRAITPLHLTAACSLCAAGSLRGGPDGAGPSSQPAAAGGMGAAGAGARKVGALFLAALPPLLALARCVPVLAACPFL